MNVLNVKPARARVLVSGSAAVLLAGLVCIVPPVTGAETPPAARAVDPEQAVGMVRAARFGQDDTVKFFLSREVPVDARGDLGNTALIAAAGGGHVAIAGRLIEAGAAVNTVNNEGRTALMEAAIRGDQPMVELLLAHSADAKVADKQGGTALADAVRYGHLGVVRLLLDNGADPNTKNNLPPSSPESGYTPLMYAAKHGLRAAATDWLDIVRALLGKGADPDIKNDRGDSALSVAVNAGHQDIVRALREKGAKEVRTYAGMTLNDALLEAAGNGDAAKVKEVLDSGADPNAENKAGVFALLAGASGGNPEVARLLVERGAKVNYVPNGYRAWTWTGAHLPLSRQALAESASIGDTALVLAARRGHSAVVNYLLERNADPAIANTQEDTALSVAAEQGHADIVKALLDHRVDPNEGRTSVTTFGDTFVGMKPTEHNTPLIKSSQGGHVDATRLLLEAGADPDTRGFGGKTALFWAVERGHNTVVQLLLEHKADPNEKSDGGLTPLMEASKNGQTAMARLLVEHGADVNAREGNDLLPGTLGFTGGAGMTALMFAASGGHREIVEVLLRKGAEAATRNNHGRTAQEEAANNGYADIVKLLRDGSVAAVGN